MGSLKDQLVFAASGGCDSFEVNKMRLNLPKGGYVCVKCSLPLSGHMYTAVTEQDVAGYLAHASGRDGATCILDAVPEMGLPGRVYVGTFAASINPFVTEHSIEAVVNCSDLHLSDRSDFHSWALKVESLEKNGVIAVLRLNWSDTASQKLWQTHEWDQLADAIKFVHSARQSKKNVVVHCAHEWDQLADAIKFVHSARQSKKNVVVHCAQGKSRSGAVIIAYIMTINPAFTFEKAREFVQSKRAIVDPNPSFSSQLKSFEVSEVLKELRRELAPRELEPAS